MGGKILIVEDNEVNMELASAIIQIAGFVPLKAETAQQAIEMAKSENPDLILMDISLPDMDGKEATRIIKKDPELNHIPVVAVTANAMQGDERDILEAGCDGYMSKPIDRDRFVEMIEEYVDR